MTSEPQEKTHNWGRKWTSEEDTRLLYAIDMYGGDDWKRISEHVGTRDAVKCMQRWDKVLRPDLVKGKWTDEEDNMLRHHVVGGFEHWGDVADKMPGRTAKQCRERWTNYLDPTLIRAPFSPDEDALLLNLQRQLGNKWSAISKQFTGRTENAVKLRYNALVKAAKAGRELPEASNRVLSHDLAARLAARKGERRPPGRPPGSGKLSGSKRGRAGDGNDFLYGMSSSDPRMEQGMLPEAMRAYVMASSTVVQAALHPFMSQLGSLDASLAAAPFTRSYHPAQAELMMDPAIALLDDHL